MINNIYQIKTNTVGTLWAFKTDKANKPFLNPMWIYNTLELYPDDIVCDIGAYIGEYSLIAAKKCKCVYSYEPTPDTFRVLKKNTEQHDNVHINQMAVVGNDDIFTKLFLSKGIGVTNSIIKSKDKWITVPAINYKKALGDANIVKIDVEGAEYGYDLVQPQLRGIILEFHPLAKSQWRIMAEKIMCQIENSGFKNIYRPKFDNGWDLTGTWIK